MQDDANFYRDTHRKYNLIDSADGVHLRDSNGGQLIDFGSGIGVTSIGMGVEAVIGKIGEQLERTTFVFNGYFTNEPRIKLSTELLSLCPPQMKKVIFANGGSEANEVAIKIARQYHVETGNTTKFKVISRRQSYHGNTLINLSISDRPSWSDNFSPYLQKFPKIAAPYCYRCPLKLEYPACDVACARQLEDVIQAEGPQTVSAFIAEPVVGTTVAGVTPPQEYYQIIREICDRHNVLFIADEVITGIGRTGKNFGMDHWGICPDITTVAKGLAAGYAPISAVILNDKIVRAITDGSGAHTQGFTFGGNPLSCAAALAVLQYIQEHDLIERAQKIGDYLIERLQSLYDIEIVGDVRGKGLILGIEFVRDKETKQPWPKDAALTQRIVDRAFDKGLVLIAAMPGCADGENGDQLQISPAFVFTREQIDAAVQIIREAIEQVCHEMKGNKTS